LQYCGPLLPKLDRKTSSRRRRRVVNYAAKKIPPAAAAASVVTRACLHCTGRLIARVLLAGCVQRTIQVSNQLAYRITGNAITCKNNASYTLMRLVERKETETKPIVVDNTQQGWTYAFITTRSVLS